MVVYRPHVDGGYEKSMSRIQRFNTEDEMLKSVSERISNDYKELGVPLFIPVVAYLSDNEAADEKNGWLHTRTVMVKGYPGLGTDPVLMGYADTETFEDESL